MIHVLVSIRCQFEWVDFCTLWIKCAGARLRWAYGSPPLARARVWSTLNEYG